MAGLITAAPQIVALSEHKTLMFALAGGMIIMSGLARFLSRNAPCPADPAQAALCQRLRRFGGVVLYVSAGLYLIGFFFAFLAPRL